LVLSRRLRARAWIMIGFHERAAKPKSSKSFFTVAQSRRGRAIEQQAITACADE